ncbi:Hypothetical protein SMAX5B_016297 [Scophthalmus maximus]|uniref:Uncharacterized protein n=1 Tax=Scophthalmus maximus TaxID=52904 RepID=A0A2U9BMG7_SCOMX|nr:Hypothetical protein SMAX5B_016297 [Scophthalmus maximus]
MSCPMSLPAYQRLTVDQRVCLEVSHNVSQCSTWRVKAPVGRRREGDSYYERESKVELSSHPNSHTFSNPFNPSASHFFISFKETSAACDISHRK